MSIVATHIGTSQEIRWTVSVSGRSARGLARDCTCYRPEEIREEAEQVAITEAVRRWPASTKPILVSSYENGHTTHADDDWREVCRYRQRDLDTGTPCPDHPDYHVDSRGWCWFGDHYPEKERDMDKTTATLSTTINGQTLEGELGTPEGDAVAEALVRNVLGKPRREDSPSSAAGETPAVQPYEKLPECYGADVPPRDAACYTEAGCPYQKQCEELCCAREMDGAEETTGHEPPAPPRPDYAVMDRNTGEMVQLSLLGAQWEAYKVESLRWSVSGGEECNRMLFDALVTGGELSPGAIVEVTARGVVKEHAPVFKKGSHEGKTTISLEVLHRVHVLGHMTGKVEAAQNVDGEAKALEEAD